MTDPNTVPPAAGRSGRIPGAVWALAAIGLLWGGWQLVAWGVRTYVNSRIEQNVGHHVVDFELPDLDGHVWRASDLTGKTVILHFFRSKCVSCFAEAPTIRELEQRIDPEHGVLLGVLLDAVQGYSESTTQETLQKLGYTHPILVADEAFVDAFHGAGWAHVTPVTYIIGPNGEILHALRGRQDFDAIARVLPAGVLRAEGNGGR